MEKQVHIIPKKVEERQKYDPKQNSLVLKKAESFNITIKELEELKKQKPIPPKLLTDLSKENYNLLSETGKWNYTVDKKQYDIDLKKYNEKLKLYNERLKKFDDLNWTWQLVYSGLDPNKITHYDAFKKGIHDRISFPKLLEGGGIAWLEAWHENEKPKGISPFGMFVQAEGVAQIVRAEWTDLRYNTINKGTTVAFGSKVILHIYTAGLYGQEVEVHLADSDIFTPNDKLKIAGEDFFTREVKVYKLKPNDINKKGVSGILTVDNAQVDYAQKIEIEVVLDNAWIKTAGANLQIYAVVKSIKTGTFFKEFSRSCIHVSDEKKSITLDQEPIPATNMPLIVGNVETNVARFEHCRYDSVKLDGTSIFDSTNIEQRILTTIKVDVIAGKKKTRFLDFDFQTIECERKPEKHTNKEITILEIPKGYELKADASSKAKHNDEEKKGGWDIKGNAHVDYYGGLKTTAKELSDNEKGVITVRQTQIEFDAFYNYGISLNTVTTFFEAARYFWLPGIENQLKRIKAKTESCAFQQNINITIYPDIKWSVVVGFNVNKDQVSKLFPSWDQEKTVRTLTMGNSVKYISDAEDPEGAAKNRQKHGNRQLRDNHNNYIADQEIEKQKKKLNLPESNDKPKEEAKPVKGTLSTLVETLKKIDVSVKAQINEDTELKLTEDFFKNAFNHKLYKDIFEQLRYAVDMIDGKLDNPKNKAAEEANIENFIEQNKNKLEKLKESLKRKDQEIEILYPKVTLGANWQYENVDGAKHPVLAGNVGIGYNVAFVAKPFIGIEIKWHLLDMLCKRHPISYAILAAVKGLLSALGDNPDGIRVDFTVTGQISTDINFKGNTLSKDKQITAKGASHVEAKLEIVIKIEGKQIIGKYTSIEEVGVGGAGAVGLGIESTLGLDDTGIWMQNALIFDGIKLSFEAVALVKVIKKRIKDDGSVEETPIVEAGGKIEGEVTLLANTFKSDKLYFKS
ncbi:hypothetical protein [Flavobacterium aquidurense]|uniref:Uncharacterized protein n=1 Tax=Flavobacterium aquidurense TaxID=362413 RepID=A0A0Q1BI66_9FLAO|nr:hypothetical protein [Flavobacterium aquidurense]KQB40378.1 hypothetical protein RC62_268 [Flavobacterium aquidurense]